MRLHHQREDWWAAWAIVSTGRPFSGGDGGSRSVRLVCSSLAAPSSGCDTLLPMKLRVVIEQDEDGVFVAQCPSLPGCISQGSTRSEALASIRDAIQGYIESLKKHDEPIPPPISEEMVEIAM